MRVANRLETDPQPTGFTTLLQQLHGRPPFPLPETLQQIETVVDAAETAVANMLTDTPDREMADLSMSFDKSLTISGDDGDDFTRASLFQEGVSVAAVSAPQNPQVSTVSGPPGPVQLTDASGDPYYMTEITEIALGDNGDVANLNSLVTCLSDEELRDMREHFDNARLAAGEPMATSDDPSVQLHSEP